MTGVADKYLGSEGTIAVGRVKLRVAVIDDEAGYYFIANLLDQAVGYYQVEWLSDYALALKELTGVDAAGVALIDSQFGERGGLELLTEAKSGREPGQGGDSRARRCRIEGLLRHHCPFLQRILSVPV